MASSPGRDAVSRILIGVLLGVGGVACTTTSAGGGGDSADAPKRLYYTLRSGARVEYGKPLPARTDIMVDWHYDSGAVETLTGFRGWDFLGDGRFGMLEVLGEDGRVLETIYDFAGDGRPQATHSAGE